jgi:hypothetical protein
MKGERGNSLYIWCNEHQGDDDNESSQCLEPCSPRLGAGL